VVESGAVNVSSVPVSTDPIERLCSLRDSLKDAWVTLDREHLQFFEGIFERIDGRDKAILEVGSGFGLTCLLFAILGAKEAHGIELIDRAVKEANRLRDTLDHHLPAFFTQHNAAEPLPFPDGRFDALLLVEVISHVVTPEFPAFMAEMSRVIKRGGVIYISDGNNGYSPHRRKVNQEIWNRFENGPPTAAGETIHTHQVRKPYIDSRREIAQAADLSLTDEQSRQIAANTFCYTAEQVQQAAVAYARTGELPQSRFAKGICPIEPVTNMYIEKMFDPFALCRLLKDNGFTIELLTTRRALPFQRILDALPHLTMLVSNGFVIMARKV
jgi:SAM-dependent methyltransferase